jgi:hypothetical protein
VLSAVDYKTESIHWQVEEHNVSKYFPTRGFPFSTCLYYGDSVLNIKHISGI